MEYHVLTEKTIKKATQMRGFFQIVSSQYGKHLLRNITT